MGYKMETQISNEELKQIENGINEKYLKVAVSPEGHFQYPTGRKGLEALSYDSALVEQLPEEAVSSYCGVGNPFSLGPINPGEQVLDIGCGAGVDTILAAMMVGPQGSVTGVDVVTEMIEKAKSRANEMYSAIKPYERYIGLAALVLVIDHFMFKGAFGGRLKKIAEQVMDKFLAAFDNMLDKLGIDLGVDDAPAEDPVPDDAPADDDAPAEEAADAADADDQEPPAAG